MPVRTADAIWQGSLKEGSGKLKLGEGTFNGNYSFKSRFEEGGGTNPEELIAAAHAGCFSMALANVLSDKGHEPTSVETTAKVHLDKSGEGFEITTIELETEVHARGLDDQTLQDCANDAKENCPVSKALAGPEITVEAKLR